MRCEKIPETFEIGYYRLFSRPAPQHPQTVNLPYQFVFVIRHGHLYGVRSFQYVNGKTEEKHLLCEFTSPTVV
jgi:hypothetical protein